MEFLHGHATQLSNTDLAATLATLGIPLDPEQPFQVLIGDREQIGFRFLSASHCGTYQIGEMVRAWDSPEFQILHPHHPLSYCRTALVSRHRLISHAKGTRRAGIAVRPGGKLEVIPLPLAARAPTAKRYPAPEETTTPRLRTEDLDLAAALLALGIPLWADLPLARSDGRLAFFFQPADPAGQHSTAALMLAWEDPDWPTANPEHPFAYLAYAFQNRRILMREVRQSRPMICLMKNDIPQFLTLNADPAVEQAFLREFDSL